MPDLKNEINALFNGFSITHTEQQTQCINDYINLLEKWNKAYNLTAVRDVKEMLDRHIADSLSIASFIEGHRFIDVGTGPGLPGIPLAIIFPDREFFLLDSNGKKTRFLQEAKNRLGLQNIEIINDRVENFRPALLFDGVLSRAFATLDDMVSKSSHLCNAEGCYYAMKGQYPGVELQAITKTYKVHPLHWSDNAAERHLVVISQKRG